MAARIGGGSPGATPSPSLSTDNRLERMREEQIRQLQEMQLVKNRDDGSRLLEKLARQLQQRNAGQDAPDVGLRVGRIDPQPETRRPDERPNRGQQAPGTTSPASQPASPTVRPDQNRSTQPGAQPAPAPAPPPPSPADFPKLVADFQRQNGLPVTGRLDPQTVNTMKDRGVMPPPGASSTTTNDAATQRPVASKEDVAATRQQRAAADQQQRQRVSEAPTKRESAPSTSTQNGAQPSQADRVVDPARLLASLVTAGFTGAKGNLAEGLKTFQATFGLPITGKLDPKTQEALEKQGVIPPNASNTDESHAAKTQSDRPVEAKQQVRRALSETAPTSRNAADRDVKRDPLRPQANTDKQTTTADVAARAPVTSNDAAAAADKARLDTVLAQQAATERGVQEGKGDPTATAGHGEIAGPGAGHKGSGGTTGGGNVVGQGPGALTAQSVDGEEGDESAVGNAKAGDDDFLDETRGEANVKGDDIGEGDGAVEHWSVPPLSEQVAAALEKIARDDDGAGPVTYTWDVTFFRPGVYAAGQPAEEIWRVAVHKATAFDAVWQTAADAIASRMLYAEPDAQPPTLDDFIMALRRARVREATSTTPDTNRE